MKSQLPKETVFSAFFLLLSACGDSNQAHCLQEASRLEEGSPCCPNMGIEACDGNLSCISLDQKAPRCRALFRVPDGEACAFDHDCMSLLCHESGLCAASPGQACDAQLGCGSGSKGGCYSCVEGQCEQDASAGCKSQSAVKRGDIPSPMARVLQDLEFDFGPEGLCMLGNSREGEDGGDGARDQSCEDEGSLSFLYPKVRLKLAPFAIDQYEVTNQQYAACVARGACVPPIYENAPDLDTQRSYYSSKKFANYPVLNVSEEQAEAYCAYVGKRLPSEFEWERVAKGGGPVPRPFPTELPISSLHDCEGVFAAPACNTSKEMLEVGSHPKDFVVENGIKIFDLGSNASEWTSTPWHQDITCMNDAPCRNKLECQAIEDQSERETCLRQAVLLPDDDGGCAACLELSEGSCFYMCEGTRHSRGLVCQAYDPELPQVPEGLAKDSDSPYYSVRGGNVTLTSDLACLFHSWYREQRLPQGAQMTHIGFRCARDL